MLPLENRWYRRLLVVALALGVGGGLSSLVFTVVTNKGINFFFAGTGTGWWEGNWWWIVLTALGGLVVAVLRKLWKVPKDVPGPVALAHDAWVNPAVILSWATISAVSLIAGASLGPFFAFTVMGGGLGSWLASRLEKPDEEEALHEYTLTGMAGGMGAAFSAPLFATILASELSPTAKKNYVAAFIPQLFAATIGFVIYFGVTGSTILYSYALPSYEFKTVHLLTGALLGVLAALILILFVVVKKLTALAFARLSNPLAAGLIGGALVGLIAFALPLTANSGNSQLATEIQLSGTMGAGFIAAILIGKMIAIAISQESGFMGGVVFASIFLGGTAGILVNAIFPAIPITLSVGALLAAVPGAFFNAPVTLLLIAAGTIGIGPIVLVPLGIAVVTSHITLALVQNYVVRERKLALQEPN